MNIMETPESVKAQAKLFDVERVRADFPILSRQVNGNPLVYLDNGASAQKPKCVLERIHKAYAEEYANVHRGLHYLSNLSTANFEQARKTVAKFLNAPSEDNIVFTRNASEAINLVAHSFGGMTLEGGDEVLLTVMEHHSNIVPWHFHRQRRGVKLVWADVDDRGAFSLEAFEKCITPRTKMIAITQMSNVLGTVVPVDQVIALAHTHGIPVLVDGSQAAVHMPIDVQALDADFYVMTGHKLYGPSGIGVLYAKMQHLDAMPPFLGGGEMIACVSKDGVDYGRPPYKFEAGTPAIVQAIGLGTALDYMMEIGRDAIAAHEAELTAYGRERLAAVEGLRFIGDAPGKGGIFSFAMDGVHAHDISTVIDRYGIAVRAGHHCAEPLMARFGVTATCRASLAMYNTKADLDALAQALEKARMFFE